MRRLDPGVHPGQLVEGSLRGALARSPGGMFEASDDLTRAKAVTMHAALQPLQADGPEDQHSRHTYCEQPRHSGEVNRRQVSSGSRIVTGLSAVVYFPCEYPEGRGSRLEEVGPGETRPGLVRRARRMNRTLESAFPHVYCELDFTNPSS